MRCCRLALLVAAVGTTAPAQVGAVPEPQLPLRLTAAARGELVEVPGATVRAELLSLDEGLAHGLLAVAPEESVRVAGWPVAPGRRAAVTLARHDVYAPGAAIWEATELGLVELPRAETAFFWGAAEDDPGIRVMVAVEPRTLKLSGLTTGTGGDHELRPAPRAWAAGRGRHVLGPPNLLLDAETARAVETQRGCQLEELPQPVRLAVDESGAGARPVVAAAAVDGLHRLRVLVDTDVELMSQKFAGNTTAAVSYLANLFAALNVIYERDLDVRLAQGETFLRTASDPWDSTGTMSQKLNEFSVEGAALHGSLFGGADRHGLAMLLSGKQADLFSSQGIAWVDGLCSSTFGYSFTQVFKFAPDTSANDAFVVGHELGHNFGSPHTHCYNRIGLPYPDTCFSGENYAGGACFAGTGSCPAAGTYSGLPGVTGTLMSYCHTRGDCAAVNVFHPITVDLLDDIVLARATGGNACIFPVAPTVTRVTPASGSTASTTAVTISGTDFAAGATVAISPLGTDAGAVAASSVVVASPTTIQATIPALAAGVYRVRVTNPNGQTGLREEGFFAAAPPSSTSFFTLPPCRVFDTRNAAGPVGGPAVGAAARRVFTLGGVCGIPNDALGVSVNVTVTAPGAAGHVEGYPGNAFPMGTSVVSFRANQTRAASAVLPLATDGSATLGFLNGAAATTHLILDVNGYFADPP